MKPLSTPKDLTHPTRSPCILTTRTSTLLKKTKKFAKRTAYYLHISLLTTPHPDLKINAPNTNPLPPKKQKQKQTNPPPPDHNQQ